MGRTVADTPCFFYVNSCDNELPAHPVTVSTFYLNSTEVTFKEFDYYTMMMGLPKVSSLDEGQVDLGRGNRPVVNVTWFDAVKYINWLNREKGWPKAYNENTGELIDAAGNPTSDVSHVVGYRLPTEAEWEYAARNRGQDIINTWGNGEPVVHGKPAANIADSQFKDFFNPEYLASLGLEPLPEGYTWQVDDGFARLAPVGSFAPSELGLFDMSGSVWEWTNDAPRVYTEAPQINPVGDASDSRRVMRGGSWDNGPGIHLVDRPSVAHDDETYSKGVATGFRLARSISMSGSN